MSVVLVEQNARAALAVAAYGYVVEHGRIAVEGTADKLTTDPKVAGTYLGFWDIANRGRTSAKAKH